MSTEKSYFDVETFLSVFCAFALALALYGLTSHLLAKAGKNFLGE